MRAAKAPAKGSKGAAKVSPRNALCSVVICSLLVITTDMPRHITTRSERAAWIQNSAFKYGPCLSVAIAPP